MMKHSEVLFTGKKAFSLMEIIIATALLSVVMLSLYKVKANNIFILEKSKKSKEQNDYLNLAMDSKEYSKRNVNIYLDKYFNIKYDDIRREFKKVKIKVKDQMLNTNTKKIDAFTLKVSTFKTNYSFEKGISKDIYRFKLEL